jgi:glutamate/tyrosine decarboxylase-like PLP-dependent enzyme
MANFVCFLAARAAKATWDVRTKGLAGQPRLLAYASTETHTWLQKAADLFGFGSDAIRWIPVDAGQRMNPAALEAEINRDLALAICRCRHTGSVTSSGLHCRKSRRLPRAQAVVSRIYVWA